MNVRRELQIKGILMVNLTREIGRTKEREKKKKKLWSNKKDRRIEEGKKGKNQIVVVARSNKVENK